VTDHQDNITLVLRECEERLRLLASQGRLTTDALAAFLELSVSVQRETDRRKGAERRAAERGGQHRRLVEADRIGEPKRFGDTPLTV
jgi:hypothetical protein